MIRTARLLKLAFLRYLDHNGPDRAAAVAYYTLLSLLPLLIFLISVGVALLGSFDVAFRGTLQLVHGVMVPLNDRALDALREFVERAVRFRWPGILLLAWTSRRVFGSLLSALETVFEAPARSFARGNFLSFSLVLIAGVLMLASLALTTLVAAVLGFLKRAMEPLELALPSGRVAFVLSEVISIAIAMSFFFVVYRFFPRRMVAVPARFALLGAVIATVLWEIAKFGFAYYVRNLARYAGLYGALEGIIVLAVWLEISASIVLYGAESVAILVSSRNVQAEATARAKPRPNSIPVNELAKPQEDPPADPPLDASRERK